MAGYRIPGPLKHDGEPMDEGTSALTRSPTPGPLGGSHGWPWGDKDDPRFDYDSWGHRINREDLKKELVEDIGHLILDITGIFDPTPFSDGNHALLDLAHGRWLDALVSTVSIVPYIGDVSKVPRMLDYSSSIKKAIELAHVDLTWRSRLRSVLRPLRSLLDKALAIEDEVPDLTRKYLQEMRHEIDWFVTPKPMRTLKPKAPANIEHAVPGGPSKKPRRARKEKNDSKTSEDAFKEQSQDSKIGEKKVGGESRTPDTDVVPNGNEVLREMGTRGIRNQEILTITKQERIYKPVEELGLNSDDFLISSHMSVYSDNWDKVFVGPNVFPGSSRTANSVFETMTPRAVIAHEAGHMISTRNGTAFEAGSLFDEVGASLTGRELPGLSKVEKYQLLRDAAERARNDGQNLREVLSEMRGQ